jgi:hypothetical protein
MGRSDYTHVCYKVEKKRLFLGIKGPWNGITPNIPMDLFPSEKVGK